jgi:vitamin B12 transporter
MRAVLAGVLAGVSCLCRAQGDAVVVTASRSEQLLRESIPHTTVITQREIRESQAVDLPTLLRREAGFEFTQNGGIGRTSGTFMRGTASAQSLVLVDGVRIGDLNNGIANLDQFMLDQIERVEIVRGNVGSLYGSGAMGGVIQIFTHRGRGEPRATVDLAAGEEGDRRVRLDYGGELKDTRFNLNASYFTTDGFSALRSGISPTADPDRDGYRNESFTGSLAHRLAAGHEAGLSYYTTDGKQHYDNAFALAQTDKQTAKVKLDTFSAWLHNQLAPIWLSKLNIARSKNSNHEFVDGVTSFDTLTTNQQLTWQNDLTPHPDHRVIAGLERIEQEIEGTIAYQRTDRDIDALFAGYRGKLAGRHHLQVNVRDERFSDFGDSRTHLVGYAFELTDRWRVFASGSTGFRAPTFNELFFPPIDLGGGFFLACNDPALKPERARSKDGGLQYASGTSLLKIVAFSTDIKDLITPGCPPVNINEATIDGLEMSFSGEWMGTSVKAALTLQDPVQHTATGQQQLVRRAKEFGSVSVAKAFGPWRLGAELLASGPKPDIVVTSFTGERVKLPGYGVVNAVARYAAGKDTNLGVRLDNVFDKDYELTHGYNVQRRKATLSVSHRF